MLEWTILAATAPLRWLYLQGPALGGWGFWEGRPPGDICAELTHLPAEHFLNEPEGAAQCGSLVERKFVAFCLGATAVSGTALMVAVCSQSVTYMMTVRPLLTRLDGLLRLHGAPSRSNDAINKDLPP